MDDPQQPSTPMEDLLAEALARIEVEGPEVLGELCDRHPELADGLRRRVAWLLGKGLAGPQPAEDSQRPDQLGDFRLLEPLGQGGMGVVYRARQLSLDREVALKLVRPEQLYFPEARVRFQREVTTVAGLAHPGIVPVYAVGEEQGVPYCAMELVRGAALSAIIAQLAQRDPHTLSGADLVAALDAGGCDPGEQASQLFDGPWPTVCARIAREVAEALEHAHRRGVVHRDIKPSNVMITRGGRVMLVDFGLSSRTAGEERQTRTGAQVGTLAYMPPEQLRGEREVDARADVFALGVTLHELLVLRLPFDPDPLKRTVQEAESGAAAQLRKHDSRITWELETVVQTAIEPDPGRRYGSAEDLGADLTRVLEGRPIEARRSSAWLRARRWMRRHPAWTALAAGVVLGPSLLAWQQVRSNHAISLKSLELAQVNGQLAESNSALEEALLETSLQRDAAEAARARAERAFDSAFDSIELMLGRVGGEVLEDVPGVEPIRRELLADALRMHAQLLAEPIVDRRQRALHATTLRRSAMIHAELGDYAAALAALDDEALLLDGLLADTPGDALALERGTLDYRRAEVHKLVGELNRAEDCAEQSIELLVALEARAAEPRDVAWHLARARMELADVLTRAGRPEQRKQPLELALAGLRAAGASETGSARERRELARVLHLLGSPPALLASLDAAPFDLGEGEAFLDLAEALRRDLLAETPGDPSLRRALAETLLARSVYATDARDFERGYGQLEEAWELYARLRDEFPARPVYLDGFAAASLNLSQLSGVLGLAAERARWLDQAVAGFEQLVESVPDAVNYRRNLGLCLGQLGQAHLAPGDGYDPELAVELLERSLAMCLPLLKTNQADPNLRLAVGWVHSQLVQAHGALGDAQSMVAVGRGVLALEPAPVELIYVAQFLSMAIAVARADGSDVQSEHVEAWLEEALGLVERALEAGPQDRAVQGELSGPDMGPLAEDPRFVALLDWYGLGE